MVGEKDAWIQVDLGRMQPITGIVTQGRHGTAQFVTKYKVEVGPDVYNLKPVMDDGNIVVSNESFGCHIYIQHHLD